MFEDKTILTNGLIFGWSFLIAVFAIPSIIYVAHLKNLLDRPNNRTVHEVLTPRLGGLAIFAGLMSSIMIFGRIDSGIQYLLAGSIILFFIGLKDDMVSVSASKKFFVQVLATGIVMFMGDIRVTSFQGIFGIHELSDGMSYTFTFFVIVGITNAINLIDGIDGLAGSLIFISSTVFGILFYQYGGNKFLPYSMMAFSLAGGVLGFLRYNFRNAIIFMGDTGSLVSGFILAVLAIQLVEMRTMDAAPAIAISILYIPIFDTVRVFGFRILKGISPFVPDKNHIHHIIISTGMKSSFVVLTITLFNLLIIVSVLNLTSFGNLFILVTISILFALFAGVFTILSKRKNNA